MLRSDITTQFQLNFRITLNWLKLTGRYINLFRFSSINYFCFNIPLISASDISRISSNPAFLTSFSVFGSFRLFIDGKPMSIPLKNVQMIINTLWLLCFLKIFLCWYLFCTYNKLTTYILTLRNLYFHIHFFTFSPAQNHSNKINLLYLPNFKFYAWYDDIILSICMGLFFCLPLVIIHFV